MIREYLKLARSFNAALTGIAPVMGAIAMGQYDIGMLFLLFLIGFWGHTFGFVYNDIHDYKVDKSSREIKDRPLVSGTISLAQAWVFAILSILLALSIAVLLGFLTQQFYPILILVVSAGCIIIYDRISKRRSYTDLFVSSGIFFLILYGASTTVPSLSMITPLTWIVCTLGAIQSLFMQVVTGAVKDLENDSIHGVWTLANSVGVHITNGSLHVTRQFKTIAYSIQLFDLAIVFLPFFIIWQATVVDLWQIAQWATLVAIGILMLLVSSKLLSMRIFNRARARMLIGSHYLLNFSLVPIMLMSQNPTSWVLVLFPGLGFLVSNLMLHGTLLQPKTM
jgi:4-hydroxybenzoate polyprenyltransferase